MRNRRYKRKYPRISFIGTDAHGLWFWRCNICYATTSPLVAWLHTCGERCSCGHVFHDKKKCPGKFEGWKCTCAQTAPTYEI